jgi:hypothetical protein
MIASHTRLGARAGLIKAGVAFVAIAATAAQPVMAQTTPCVTSVELRAGGRFLLPLLIEAADSRCRDTLGDKAYLSTHAGALAQRYAAQSGDDAAVTALVGKIDSKHEMKGLNLAELKAFAVAMVGKGMSTDLKPAACRKIDKVMAVLDPLPADNMISLLEIFIREVSEGNARKAAQRGAPLPKLSLCPE